MSAIVEARPAVLPREGPEPLRGRRAATVAARAPWGRRLLNYALIFVTVVLVVDSLVGDKGLIETMRARRQYAQLSASLSTLKSENARMRDEIRRLEDDPATIEAIARQELNLIRPGEVLVVVHDAKSAER